MAQNAALQCEQATLEAMRDNIAFTVIGWDAGEMLACIGNQWVTL